MYRTEKFSIVEKFSHLNTFQQSNECKGIHQDMLTAY